jgi:tetratricopeptide (TPR) repeat protein
VLIRDVDLRDYDVTTPLELPARLQSSRWQRLCEAARSFASLPLRARTRVAWTLSKLCLQGAAIDLIPPSVAEDVGKSGDHAALAFVRCYSRYRMNVDDRSAPYSIDEMRHVAAESPPGIARVDANYQMVVQHVKHTGDLGEVERWQEQHRSAIESSRSEFDDFTYLFTMSRFHRVGGFIPQMRSQRTPLVQEMDRSEQFALALPRPDATYAIAADEVLYPVLESRTKEALWLGDTDLALERARRAMELSPHDARAWLQLGQVHVERDAYVDALAAYRRAASLAPPGREIAWYMAGQCWEALDDLDSACDAYLVALQADPLGISAAEALEGVASQVGRSNVLSWVRGRLVELKSLEQDFTPPHAWPYKHIAPPDPEPGEERRVGDDAGSR